MLRNETPLPPPPPSLSLQLLVCSAPNFPDGAIDDVPKIAALAAKANVGCHVDCCLGSVSSPSFDHLIFPIPFLPLD